MVNVQVFCERLRAARVKTGMTTTEVAFALYTSQSAVSRYETGVNLPRLDRIVDMAELYGVSLDWLCGLDGGKTDVG